MILSINFLYIFLLLFKYVYSKQNQSFVSISSHYVFTCTDPGAVSNAGNINANLEKTSKNHSTGDDLFKELSAKTGLYNQICDKVPIVKELVGSEDFLVKIKLENGGTLSVTFTTNNGKINLNTFSKYGKKSEFKPSITVKTNEKTIREVLNSKNPFIDTFKFIINGSIKVEGESYFQKTVLHTLEKVL